MKKTILFTSKKNYEWTSMQEIIPFIERAWIHSIGPDHSVELVDVDESSVLKNAKKAITADNIVMTCFTVEMAIGIAALRGKLNLDFRLFFYVHGSASIAFWPLYKYQLGAFLNSSDVFVVTCEGDRKLTQLAIPNIKIIKHPFLNERQTSLKLSECVEEFVFIGRVSEQKNLHSLLFAISFLKDEFKERGLKFRVFGGEDNLGSPNMAKKSSCYLMFLEDLVKDLELHDLVIFEGHATRDTLDDYLVNTSVVFVAPSLHSDENFGMSPFNILKKGGRCLLSDWGGFSEYRNYFGNQVDYFEMYSGDYGPFLGIRDMVEKLRISIEKKVRPKNNNKLDEYYSLDGIAKIINTEIRRNLERPSPVVPERLVGELLDRREEFLEFTNDNRKNKGAQIFENYSDENALAFLNGYAGNIKKLPEDVSLKSLELLPWIEFTNKIIYLKDPRHGEISIYRNQDEKRSMELRIKEKTLLISEEELFYLKSLGYLF